MLQHDPYQLIDPTEPILPKVLVAEGELDGVEPMKPEVRRRPVPAFLERSRSHSRSCSAYTSYSYNSYYSYGSNSRSWSPRPIDPIDPIFPESRSLRSESRGRVGATQAPREASDRNREDTAPLGPPPGSWGTDEAGPRRRASSLHDPPGQAPAPLPFAAPTPAPGGHAAQQPAPAWDFRPPGPGPGQFPHPAHLPAQHPPAYFGIYPHAQYPHAAYPPPPGYGPPPIYAPDIGYGKMEARLRSPSTRGRQRRRGDRDDDRGRSRSPARGRAKKKRRRNRKPKSPGEPPPKWGDTWEEPRSSNGLKLITEIAPKSLPWRLVLKDESRRCYAAFMESPVPHARLANFFSTIRDGTTWLRPDGPQGPMPRKTAWMVRSGCKCPYRYGGVLVQPQVFPAWMTDVLRTYMPYCGMPKEEDWPDSCNVNLYEDGSNSVGWHSDDEALFQGLHHDVRIVSLSLGQQRKFDLRKNWPEEGEKVQERLHLGNGALATMEGMLQKHYMHRVPREADDLGPRINLTWRWIKKHVQECPKART